MVHERAIYGSYGLSSKPSVAPYTYSEGVPQAIISTAVALAVIGTLCLWLRIYTRLFVLSHTSTGWSLWLAIVAWVLCVPTSVLFALSAQYGLGEHFELVKYNANISQALLFQWIAVVLSLFASWFGKASALIYILDVQGPTHRNWRWVLIGLVSLNLVAYIVFTPIIFLQCSPADKLWNWQTDGLCLGGPRLFYVAMVVGSWGAFTDLVLACYPTLLISQLQIKLRFKVGLSMLLGLGVFTAICAIVKTMLFCAFQAFADQTYDNAGFVYWSIAEMWVILIVGCVPPLWPMGKRIGSRCSQLISSSGQRSPGSSSAGGILGSWKKGSSGGGKGGKGKVLVRERSADSSEGVTLTAMSYGESGIYASQVGPEEMESRSAARRYFYEYGTDQGSRKCSGSGDEAAAAVAMAEAGERRPTNTRKQSTLEKLRGSPFGEWGVIVTRAGSSEALTIDDGIRVTKDVSVTTESHAAHYIDGGIVTRSP